MTKQTYAVGESDQIPDIFHGEKIAAAELNNGRLQISFEDDTVIQLSSEGKSCSARLHITSDDNPSDIFGGVLRAIETCTIVDIHGKYGDSHEEAFIDVQTDKGSIELSIYIKNGGHYGQLGLTIRTIKS